MKVEFTHDFIKIYKKRFAHKQNIQIRFDERVRLFTKNSQSPLLHDHSLSGKLHGYQAFSVTGDPRVVYYVHNNTACFIDIGTHNLRFMEDRWH